VDKHFRCGSLAVRGRLFHHHDAPVFQLQPRHWRLIGNTISWTTKGIRHGPRPRAFTSVRDGCASKSEISAEQGGAVFASSWAGGFGSKFDFGASASRRAGGEVVPNRRRSGKFELPRFDEALAFGKTGPSSFFNNIQSWRRI